MFLKLTSFCIFLVGLLVSTNLFAESLPTCVYISSYHKGYQWSDGVESSLKRVLSGHCSLIQFDMDTKRNREQSFIRERALEARELIKNTKPDVVITSDDNAAKFVIAEHFKNSSIPFVFCGVNWTAKEYGFPYDNVTGMIEVTPVADVFELAVRITKGKRGIFIGDDTLSGKKDLEHFIRYAKKNDIELEGAVVNNIDDWKACYTKAQDDRDFIILGHKSAISGWEESGVKQFQRDVTRKLVLTANPQMVPFSMVGLVINPEEQGVWAGEAALGILEGFPIRKISITANRGWTSWMNTALLTTAGITLPEEFVEKSQKMIVN